MGPNIFDVETLLGLGLPNHVVSVWQVFAFMALLIPFLLLHRVKICLLITYLYAYYLAFLIYWGEYISSAGTMFPFFLYAFSGFAIVILYILASFREKTLK